MSRDKRFIWYMIGLVVLYFAGEWYLGLYPFDPKTGLVK